MRPIFLFAAVMAVLLAFFMAIARSTHGARDRASLLGRISDPRGCSVTHTSATRDVPHCTSEAWWSDPTQSPDTRADRWFHLGDDQLDRDGEPAAQRRAPTPTPLYAPWYYYYERQTAFLQNAHGEMHRSSQ